MISSYQAEVEVVNEIANNDIERQGDKIFIFNEAGSVRTIEHIQFQVEEEAHFRLTQCVMSQTLRLIKKPRTHKVESFSLAIAFY